MILVLPSSYRNFIVHIYMCLRPFHAGLIDSNTRQCAILMFIAIIPLL